MAVVAVLSCALAVVTRATAQASMSVEVSSARITRVPGTEVLTVGADDGADELTGITGPSLAAVHASVKSHSLASVALLRRVWFRGISSKDSRHTKRELRVWAIRCLPER